MIRETNNSSIKSSKTSKREARKKVKLPLLNKVTRVLSHPSNHLSKTVLMRETREKTNK